MNILIAMIVMVSFFFPQECAEPINIWYKVSNDDKSIGQIVELDMSKGQAFSDAYFIYLVVQDNKTKEIVIIAFPNGGDWVADTYDPFLEEMEKEFKSLEEYLRANQKNTITIEKK